MRKKTEGMQIAITTRVSTGITHQALRPKIKSEPIRPLMASMTITWVR